MELRWVVYWELMWVDWKVRTLAVRSAFQRVGHWAEMWVVLMEYCLAVYLVVLSVELWVVLLVLRWAA